MSSYLFVFLVCGLEENFYSVVIDSVIEREGFSKLLRIKVAFDSNMG